LTRLKSEEALTAAVRQPRTHIAVKRELSVKLGQGNNEALKDFVFLIVIFS
jgi:hypothetical protein